MSAKAWPEQDSGGNGSIETILRPILPTNSHQWDVKVTRQEREWEPFGADRQDYGSKVSGRTILSRNGIFNAYSEQWLGGGIVCLAGSDPYSLTDHYLRLSTELHQFETYDEPVIFHNIVLGHSGYTYYFVIPKPISITTPSGVSVILPAQGRPKWDSSGSGITVLVTVKPAITPDPVTYPLPNSPLARTFGKPVQLSLTFPPPYSPNFWSDGQNGAPASYTLLLPRDPKDFMKTLPMPSVIKNLTIIVNQRVDLQTIPMTFTVPIADHAPPYYPKDYKGHRF